jgi:hypothetical protein
VALGQVYFPTFRFCHVNYYSANVMQPINSSFIRRWH